MQILMSGQIYIKRGPTIIEIEPEDIMAICGYDEEDLEKFGDEICARKVKDYRGCTSFWISVIKDDGIDMVESLPVANSKTVDFICDAGNLEVNESQISNTGAAMHFASSAEMEEEFMPLTEFLAKAKFIGRKFKINTIHPVFDVLNRGNDRTALYATDNIILIENYSDKVGHIFEIIRVDSKKDIDCSLHEVDTTLDDTYKNKALVYKKVFDYMLENKRKKL